MKHAHQNDKDATASLPDQEEIVVGSNIWTTDHHLVGKQSVTRTLLCDAATTAVAAATDNDSIAATPPEQKHPCYVYRTHTVPICAFEPEDPAERKPALWRGLVLAGPAPSTRKKNEGKKQQQVLALAVDCVAADFQQQPPVVLSPTSEAMLTTATTTATRLVQERYASVVYQQVLQDILPTLILKAAVEECQAQFLHQQVLAISTTATLGTTVSTTATASSSVWSTSSSSSAPQYYRHSPSSYLVPPTAAVKNKTTSRDNNDANFQQEHTTLPVAFTPSQLVSRIKQGCAMAWQEIMAPLLQQQQQQQERYSSSSSSLLWEQQHQRRASSRLARQQEQQPASRTATSSAATADAFQKIIPGGQIAFYLKETILTTRTDNDDDKDETTNELGTRLDKNDDDHQKHEDGKATTMPTKKYSDNNDNDNLAATLDKDKEQQQQVSTNGATPKETEEVKQAETVHEKFPIEGDEDKEQEEDAAVADEDEEQVTNEKEDDEYAPEEEDGDDEDDEAAASYIKERADVLHVDMNDERQEDRMEEDGSEQDEEEAEEEEEEEEEIDLVHDGNPYLQANGMGVLEWLGQKTAKHLSTADIQVSFPSLLPPKQTKKKKVSAKEMSKIGGDIADFLTPTDRLIWQKMLPNYGPALVTDGARFFFQIVNEEDTSQIDQWESSSFGRSQFAVRIWNQGAEEEIAQRAYDEYAVAEMEYRGAKAWGAWRYRGINSGYTVWPSWLDAVEAWRKEHATEETVATTVVSTGGIIQPPHLGVDVSAEDRALAQALAEEEAMVASSATTRRSRRSAEGGGGGVYYGTQSNMTQKQLMDTILRLVSQNTYKTAVGIMQAIPDESTDPLRRIRVAIGKLVWKRNQLARQVVQPSWSDASVWADVSHSSLVTLNVDKGNSLKVECSDAEKTSLLNYIQELHKTELRLRQMVLDHLADTPIAIIATSADERAGSLEAMDDVDFENGAADGIDWRSSGHQLLGKLIYRPATTTHSDEIAPCRWYRVRDFSAPLASEPEEGESAFDRAPIGAAKEAEAVRRRSRFRAFPSVGDDSTNEDAGEFIILTEGQVCAGAKAAEMEQRRADTPDCFSENPFAGTKSSLVTLIPPENSSAGQVTGTVVGHDSIVDDSGCIHQRILLLPEEENPQQETIWVRLAFPDSGVIECRIEGDPIVYTVQQYEYHSSSPAFQECRNIVNFLIRHTKAGPFLEPVDPVALNIPDYFNVIKHPMDVSTLSHNLDSGKYSNIPPRDARGRSATARMLNGPFRKDVELIFDNAMLFNPPADWIHQSAAALKKAVTRKIDQAIKSAEDRFVSRSREKHSVYVEEDSDADVYVYESDEDEEYDGSALGGRKRKRSDNRTPIKEESSTRSIERPIRLQKVLSESMGLRGPLSNIPVITDSSSFSLPNDWVCRRRKYDSQNAQNESGGHVHTELDELVGLYKAMEEREASGLRRSTRTHHIESEMFSTGNDDTKGQVEYLFLRGPREETIADNEEVALPRSRSQIEVAQEQMHEEYFAKLYHKLQEALDCKEYGTFADGSFPPYLGRVVPAETRYREQTPSSLQGTGFRWEIREAYLIPALRWVIRGLIQSKHLSELESVDTPTDTGVILPNHVYFLDPKAQPFDVVDVRELTRKKRANDAAAESSDDEVELSAYEKMRAERVARNEERLKALGLA